MTIDRYTEGWNDHIQYLQDKIDAGNAGTALSALGGISLIMGIGFLTLVLYGAFDVGWAQLNHPFAEKCLGGGMLLLFGTYLLWTESSRQRTKALKAFNDKWHAAKA